MYKPTLLQITQEILNDLSSDEVASINDTVESTQVASIVRSAYTDMMSNRDWSHTKKLIMPVSDATLQLPTHITFDDSMKELISVFYDKTKTVGKIDSQQIKFLLPDDFLRFTNQRNTLDGTTETILDPSGVNLLISKKMGPTYYTSFDDKQVVFDSYDSSMESFLAKAKFQCYGYVIPEWTQGDTFVPPLPVEVFPLLINEAKSRASLLLRQQPDQKAEQQSTRQDRFMARKGWSINADKKFPNYGRHATHMQGVDRCDPTFRRGN